MICLLFNFKAWKYKYLPFFLLFPNLLLLISPQHENEHITSLTHTHSMWTGAAGTYDVS